MPALAVLSCVALLAVSASKRKMDVNFPTTKMTFVSFQVFLSLFFFFLSQLLVRAPMDEAVPDELCQVSHVIMAAAWL